MDKNLYLTDEQYLDILGKIEDKLHTDINPVVSDSTIIGDKSVDSNIGLCNEDFTTLETALFPEDFKKHGRNSMKYRQSNQACPFDNRVRTKENLPGRLMSLGCGCYYTCTLQNKKPSVEELRAYVVDTKDKFLNGELDNINEKITK